LLHFKYSSVGDSIRLLFLFSIKIRRQWAPSKQSSALKKFADL
jgi:hypothetical protein